MAIDQAALQRRQSVAMEAADTRAHDEQLSGLEPVILRDGLPVWLRAIRPTDAAAMAALFDRASQQSLLLRFFTPLKRVERSVVDQLVRADGIERMAYVAVRDLDSPAGIIAVGQYTRYPKPDAADVAFFVDDEYQGNGLGTLLLERLALHARDHGIVRLHADVLTVNERMLQVFRDSGLVTGVRSDGDTLSINLVADADEAALTRTADRERTATVASLQPIFCPRSVAVIGASRHHGAVGRMAFSALLAAEFAGPVFPINPAARSVGSVKAYGTVLEVPDPIDLAVVAVPADQIAALIPDCAAKGVRGLIVLSAGFAETGPAGQALQDDMLLRARAAGMRLIGPNCIGLVNTAPEVRLNASFSPAFPAAGAIAMASQSGAIGLGVLALANERRLGISTFVSIGNRADVSPNDLLQYWQDDAGTGLILLYLESFGNPRKFARIARRVGRTKPILAVKAGRTAAGSRAARSHTAALATDERGTDALFRQAGIIRTETLEELFDVTSLLAGQPLPPGRRVAIVTNAGGPAIMCADACEAQGLTLASLSPDTLSGLTTLLPAAAARSNPVDMIASATEEQFAASSRLLLADPNVDALIVIHTPLGSVTTEQVAAAVHRAVAEVRAAGGKPKPVLACVTPPAEGWNDIRAAYAPAGAAFGDAIPIYRFPEPPARALAHAAAYAEWRRLPPGTVPPLTGTDPQRAREVIDSACERGSNAWLQPDACEQVLAAAGISIAPCRQVASSSRAAAAAAEMGFPVALKIVSQQHLHKSDVGGVVLNLRSKAAVLAACRKLRNRLGSELEGFLVQSMVAGGIEVFAGVQTDPSFGPLIAFGLGGTAVEALNDVAIRITPLTDADAASMVRSIRARPLLEGLRGGPAADIAALERLLLRLSWLVETVPEITELDLNPVLAMPEGSGAMALDARIRVRR